MTNWLNSYFKLSESKTTVRTEVLAGITTFITVAYILILNPQILSHPYEIMGDMDMAARISNGVFIGTCIASFVGTILCALYATVPFVQAPGMGLNAFFAYTVVLAMGYTYSQSLVVVFISGVLFLGSLILAPIVGIIPSAATAPALIFVGILMLSNVKDVDLKNMESALPAFCTIVFMPFTYSIANGIAIGLITYCMVQLLTGNWRKIKPLTVIVALIFVARYAFMTLG